MLFRFDKGEYVAHCDDVTEFLEATAAGLYTNDTHPPFLCKTQDPRVAVRLRAYANKATTRRIEDAFIRETTWSGRLPHPKDLAPKQYQKIAAWFALSRKPASYLAMDPGTGKTAVSALIHNALNSVSLFITPPALALTLFEELMRWSDHSRISFNLEMFPHSAPSIWILTDTAIHDKGVRELITAFIHFWRRKGIDPTLFIDEAHRFVNIEARRTRALFQGLVPAFRRTVYLSGTPMPNRPIELFPIIKASAWSTIDFMSELEYGRRYCAGRMTDRGWDLSGHSNMPELAAKLHGTFMHRVKKADVLPELPPKTEEVVFIGGDLPSELQALERDVFARYTPEDLVGKDLAERSGRASIDDVPLSTYRRMLGLFKTDFATKFITDLLISSEEALLVFAIHQEVIEKLNKALDRFSPLTITGQTRMDERHELVKRFQTNPKHRLMTGNIKACGVGFTLTRATRVLLPEYSWVPADNDQAIDRAHRIGQKDHVFAQYLVLRNSGDRRVLETVMRKRQVVAHI